MSHASKGSLSTLIGVLVLLMSGGVAVVAEELKHYDSNSKDYWLHPPSDWFMGDETQDQKGLFPNAGQPTPTPPAELEAIIEKIKLPSGFKIALYASGVDQARQMALGDKGTIFVGTFDKGKVNAVV